MAVAAPIFYTDVRDIIQLVSMLACVVVELVAFANCLTQRQDAFAVVGSISKAGWLGLLAGSVFVTFFCGVISLFGLIAVAAAAIYMLDVRPALRDATDGTGPW